MPTSKPASQLNPNHTLDLEDWIHWNKAYSSTPSPAPNVLVNASPSLTPHCTLRTNERAFFLVMLPCHKSHQYLALPPKLYSS